MSIFKIDQHSDIRKSLVVHLEVFINQEVTANQIKESQSAVKLGLDCKETVGHDLLHALLMHEKKKKYSSVHFYMTQLTLW